MDANLRLGRMIGDQLAIMTMFCMASNITLPDAAAMMIQVDSQVYNGSYSCALQGMMFYRGLIPAIDTTCELVDTSIRVDPGPSILACLGTNVVLGGDPTSRNYNDQYVWEPSNLISEDSSNPIYFVTSSQLFTIKVIDSLGFYNTATQFISADQCVEDFTQFQFLNTLKFNTGEDDMLVFVPGNFRSVTIRIVDMMGRLIRSYDNVEGYFVRISPEGLPPGNYVLMAEERYIRQSIKISKSVY
jgi:hypothetical protein